MFGVRGEREISNVNRPGVRGFFFRGKAIGTKQKIRDTASFRAGQPCRYKDITHIQFRPNGKHSSRDKNYNDFFTEILTALNQVPTS